MPKSKSRAGVIYRVSTRAVESRLQAIGPGWMECASCRPGPRSGLIEHARDKNSGALRTDSCNVLYWRMLRFS